ncbi:MAG: hypothetical protein VB010_14285 [Sphaerochaeta associata]|uniref:hypothetical protein n=1 Tax=Sphaerochaeta associata TaxID=1129264 RepID=UPI002B1F38A2|nr:hypothetical protein [Sphaerochaeta associata]MEA5108510.1 hypothetical protein [Sphaerochaeta associata]
MKRLVMVLTMVLLLSHVAAEIAPHEYRLMQLGSPEHIQIKVLSVSKSYNLFSGNTAVKANAEVLVVTRSDSNLSVGDRITIKYTHDKLRKNWAGPRSIPILKKKAETDAFLAFDVDQNCYVPSARGASFDPLIREY